MGEPHSAPVRIVRGYAAYLGLAAVGLGVFFASRSRLPDPEPVPEPVGVSADKPVVNLAWRDRLPKGTQVLGVSVDGQYRAYLAEAMTFQKYHVVNGELGGKPLTVTFCDRSVCAMAFTAADRTEPLDLEKGGYSEADGMLVQVGGHRYTQKTGRPVDPAAPAFPYRSVNVEKTTWGEWVAAHPDTELWTGGMEK